MSAFSFGNRWVGVVALGTPPPPEPLHKMAARLWNIVQSRKIRIGDDLEIWADDALLMLLRIRRRLAIAGRSTPANECASVERALRSGHTVDIRPWLQRELRASWRAQSRHGRPGEDGGYLPSTVYSMSTIRIKPTSWAESCPQAPESSLLPTLNDAISADLRKIDAQLDYNGSLWVRWSCIHRSYLYEKMRDSPISGEALDLLGGLGRSWIRVALLDRVRAQRGDFASSAEVSEVLTSEKQVRSALAEWAISRKIAVYGRGEATLIAADSRSRAPETVALQVVGALSLVSASQAPADALLELVGFEPPSPDIDWHTILRSHISGPVQFTRSETGPDHNKRFSVTISAQGRSVSESDTSFKKARAAAARSYVNRYLKYAIPAQQYNSRAAIQRSTPLPTIHRSHTEARIRLQKQFEIADGGLVSQALSHSSWVYEHRENVLRSHQRDLGVLAAEGSVALTALVQFQHALNCLNRDVRVPELAITSPSLPNTEVARLFDQLHVDKGVLRSEGMTLGLDLKANVAQAIVGASWRANGDLLMERQPEEMADWVESFTPARDPATLLQNYCAYRLKCKYSVRFENKGPDHDRLFRATITFELGGSPQWRGHWRSSRTQAKQSAADSALRIVYGETIDPGSNSERDREILIRTLFQEECREIDADISSHKGVAIGQLSVDLLASGDYLGFGEWSATRSDYIPSPEARILERITRFYFQSLRHARRSLLRQRITNLLPTDATIENASAHDILVEWWKSDQCAQLALFDELLSSDLSSNFDTKVLNFVERQARTISQTADLLLESVRSSTKTGHTLTLRLSGAKLPVTLEPVIDTVDTVIGITTWVKDNQSISVTMPTPPPPLDSLTVAASSAIQQAWRDPWLSLVQNQLNEFLVLTEVAFASTNSPPSEDLEELIAQQVVLVQVLRENLL